MARKQYRWTGMAKWQSQSGNAILAIQNSTSSTRRVIINSLEIDTSTVGASTGYTTIGIYRTTSVAGGREVSLVKMDTEASLPSGISILEGTNSTYSASNLIQQIVWYKGFNQGGTPLPQRWGSAEKIKNQLNIIKKDADLEDYVIHTGESISLTVVAQTCSQLLRVSGTIVVVGSPNRTYVFSKEVWARCSAGEDLLSFVNTSASSDMYIKKISIEEIGTLDTPYLQLVPIGGIDPNSSSDTAAALTPFAMDSEYGALDSNVKLIADAPLLPFGVPLSYISASSTATPKGYNYLHTKDYVGPSFFNFFPEYNRYNLGTATDGRFLPLSNKGTNLVKGAPITLRPGESLGLVSAAETAVVTTAIGTSGWSLINLGITFTLAPVIDPSLVITNLISGSDIVILEAGTSTELLNVDSHGATSYTWDYDPDVVSAIDICIYKAGYTPYVIRNYSPGSNGASIPVSQFVDRAYI